MWNSTGTPYQTPYRARFSDVRQRKVANSSQDDSRGTARKMSQAMSVSASKQSFQSPRRARMTAAPPRRFQSATKTAPAKSNDPPAEPPLFVLAKGSLKPVLAAQKTVPTMSARKRDIVSTIDISDSDSSISDHDSRASSPLPSDDELSSPSEEEDEVVIISDPNQPSPTLLSYVGASKRLSALPFLKRNVKRGMQVNAEKAITIEPPALLPPDVDVVYLYPHPKDEDREQTFRTRMRGWYCPLCDVFQGVHSQDLLMYHLRFDHPEVEVACNHSFAGGGRQTERQTWSLQLTFPQMKQVEPDDQVSVQAAKESAPQDINPEPLEAIPPAQLALSPKPISDDHNHFQIFEPEVSSHTQSEYPQSVPVSFEPTTFVEPPLAMPEGQEPFTCLTTSRESSVFTIATSRARTSIQSPPSHRSSRRAPPRTLQVREDSEGENDIDNIQRISSPLYVRSLLVPPPQGDPLGPAAQYPYLPFKSLDGGPDLEYSCRPGGPKLYDLIGTLNMEEFGVLAWEVRERDEEIFDTDDLKDEQKVMYSLWARWIFLNRNVFIGNYADGVRKFIDKYWQMIHYAAGWKALSFWLRMLLASRFITISDVQAALRHFEDKTGMDEWYIES